MKKKTVKSRRTANRKGGDPTEKLTAAWITLAAREGIHAITLQKAAKLAQVPFATAHYYFGGGLENLMLEGLKRIAQHAQAFTTEESEKARTKEGANPIRDYARVTFRWIAEFPEYARVGLYSYYHGCLSEHARAHQVQVVAIARQRALRLLLETKGMGLVRDANPLLAQMVHSLIFGLGIQAIMLSAEERGRLLEECLLSIDHLLK